MQHEGRHFSASHKVGEHVTHPPTRAPDAAFHAVSSSDSTWSANGGANGRPVVVHRQSPRPSSLANQGPHGSGPCPRNAGIASWQEVSKLRLERRVYDLTRDGADPPCHL